MFQSREGGSSYSSSRKMKILVFLVLAFLFRFLFGLYCPSVVEDDDQVQTYLIGLKSYTTQTWPYFGPDMQGGTVQKGQMPGALEGLLIRGSLEIWPSAVSPYLLVNLLTFFAFSFLAWYCCRRLPNLSPWFVFGWIYLAPWDTHFSTVIMNQSFSIVGAILFFVGFLESFPQVSAGVLPISWSNVLMGFGLFWVVQLHMSWVMFVPLLMVSFYFQYRTGTWKRALGWGILGSLPMLALLIPTYLKYGFRMTQDISGNATCFNEGNVFRIWDLLGRYFSFASFELPRFLGENAHDRIVYLTSSPWLLPAGFFLWIVGILQAILLFLFLFLRRNSVSQWNAVRWSTLGLWAILYLEFFFSRKPPSAHRYYEALPLVMIYSFYCWNYFSNKVFWRRLAVIFLVVGLYFQIGYALKAKASGVSVYSQYHTRMNQAIVAKDYHLLGERRPAALY